MAHSMEVDSNAALPNHSAWQNIFNDWDTIVANSNIFNFAVPLSVPSRIRQLLHQAHAVGKSSLSSSTPLNFAQLYPTAATDLQIEIINKAVCFGQGLALLASKPSNNNDSAASPSNSVVPRQSEPEKFDGTRSKFGSYVTRLQLQFRSNQAAFSSDESKILYAGSYLNGNAYTWFEPHVNQETGEVDFQTFPDFLEALRAAFDDPDAYATSERQLEALRQDGSCAAYYAKIVSIFSLLGWTEQRVQIHHFRKGLKELLKDALVGKKMPTTFPEFATQCIALDNEIFARLREKKSISSPPHIGHPLPLIPTSAKNLMPSVQNTQKNDFAGDPMELDNSEAGKAARKAYRWANNLCGYCGKPGHKIASCPTLASRSSNYQTHISNTEVLKKHEPLKFVVEETKN